MYAHPYYIRDKDGRSFAFVGCGIGGRNRTRHWTRDTMPWLLASCGRATRCLPSGMADNQMPKEQERFRHLLASYMFPFAALCLFDGGFAGGRDVFRTRIFEDRFGTVRFIGIF